MWWPNPIHTHSRRAVVIKMERENLRNIRKKQKNIEILGKMEKPTVG